MSTAETQGIRVTVRTQYLPDQSSPDDDQYAFAYTIHISNEGTATAQLVSRHWIITDATGKVEEVRGLGVVGQQPTLHAGEFFEYTSGCVLRTTRGTMHGTYRMVRTDGTEFDAEIAPFALVAPTENPYEWLH
jgi:ApaG protein